MLPLTAEQRVKVEENMGLVGRVIQDCVHTLDKGCVYDYDDLFQIGCLGLCKAAQTDRPGHKGAFSTYAYLLIRNEIYTQLEYATRRGRELATDPYELPCTTHWTMIAWSRPSPAVRCSGCWNGRKPVRPVSSQRGSKPSACWRRATPIGRSASGLVCLLTM